MGSTKVIYDAKWRRFAVWCHSCKPKVVPHLVTEPQMAEFIASLHEDKTLTSLSAILGYRSAINSVLKCFARYEVVSSPNISRMMQSVRRLTPKSTGIHTPKWNLALILRYLAKKPFEPVQSIDMKFLTFKTVFLVLLSTACRRSELHALDVSSVEHDKNWTYINVSLLSDFLAKHQAHSKDYDRIRSFAITAMKSDDAAELKLCPVRCLRAYILRSNPLRAYRQRLFIPFEQTKTGNITANTITGWIKTIIRAAYDDASEEDIRVTGMQDTIPNLFRPVHEIRALAGSLAWTVGNSSLKDIMAACYWKNHTVFTDHYLRDVTAIKDDQLVINSSVLRCLDPQ
jgi:hypothetical protein